MKKVLKKRLGIIGICMIGVLIFVAAFLYIKNYLTYEISWMAADYYTAFQSHSELEMQYAGRGSYEVSQTAVRADDKMEKIRIWYPTAAQSNTEKYPLIIVVNASNVAAKNYPPFFERLASWGFIVVGNDDRETGTGESTSNTLDYMLEQNDYSGSAFYGRIDVDNIGVVGYSQGGAGAIRAVTEYDNSNRYRALFTGSAAYAQLAQRWGSYEVSKIGIPWFMTAGTGASDDSGVEDITRAYGGVAPLASLIDNYNGVTADVWKVRARVVGAEHDDMQMKTDAYMTAWMLYWLQGDDTAGTVFLGEDAELLHNANWQDVEKNL